MALQITNTSFAPGEIAKLFEELKVILKHLAGNVPRAKKAFEDFRNENKKENFLQLKEELIGPNVPLEIEEIEEDGFAGLSSITLKKIYYLDKAIMTNNYLKKFLEKIPNNPTYFELKSTGYKFEYTNNFLVNFNLELQEEIRKISDKNNPSLLEDYFNKEDSSLKFEVKLNRKESSYLIKVSRRQ